MIVADAALDREFWFRMTAEDRQGAIHEELVRLFPGELPAAFAAFMVSVREKLEAFEGRHATRAFESGVAEAANRLSAQIVRQALVSLDTQDPVIEYRGERYRREGATNKRVMTSFGAINYERSRYRRRSRASVFPADRLAGLIEDFWTPRAAYLALQAVSSMPPRDCVKMFRRQGGMCPGVSSLIRLYEVAGRHWEEIADDALAEIRHGEEIPSDATSVTIQMDGVMVPVGQDRRKRKQDLEGITWKEAACATITLGNAAGERLRTLRHARMPEANKLRLKQLIRDEVHSLLARRPDLELVVVANGARDHWRFFEEAFPEAEQVLDFFHAADYLKEALDHAYGQDSIQGNRRWHILRETLLVEISGVDKVIASLAYLKRSYSPLVSRAIGYFTNNRKRMNYADYRRRNLTIGSGLVEATNKSLVTQRLKGSGMIWGQSGGQAILSLRALDKSDRFDTAWNILEPYWQKKAIDNY